MCSTWWSILATGDCAESASWTAGLVEVPLDDHVDRAVQRRREQHPLALLGGPVEDPLDGGQEAEVGHVVRLVEHGHLDRAERAVALADQVLEPAGTGEHDVGAAAQTLHLRVLADAAEDGLGGQAGGLGQRRERLVDLADELAGRGQDQRPRRLRGGAATGLREPGHDRQEERVGLAGAGAAAAEHVAPGECVGQRGRLDRRGLVDAARREERDEVGGHAEIGERSRGSHGGCH